MIDGLRDWRALESRAFRVGWTLFHAMTAKKTQEDPDVAKVPSCCLGHAARHSYYTPICSWALREFLPGARGPHRLLLPQLATGMASRETIATRYSGTVHAHPGPHQYETGSGCMIEVRGTCNEPPAC